jgi:hypothetical protein
MSSRLRWYPRLSGWDRDHSDADIFAQRPLQAFIACFSRSAIPNFPVALQNSLTGLNVGS